MEWAPEAAPAHVFLTGLQKKTMYIVFFTSVKYQIMLWMLFFCPNVNNDDDASGTTSERIKEKQ